MSAARTTTRGSGSATSSAIGYLLATTVLAAAGLASGCTSFRASGEDGPPTTPTTDAGTADAKAPGVPDDSGAPVDAADAGGDDDAGTCSDGTAPRQIALSASADTSFTSECNAPVNANGSAPSMYLGANMGSSVGLVRFELSQQDAEMVRKHTIVGGTLKLFGTSNCGMCPSVPTLPGTISVHPMRSDWDESCDRCRRATGKGWGTTSGPPEPNTPISGGGIDFDDHHDTATVPDDADEIEVALGADMITARGAIVATATISFYLQMAAGRMVVTTREGNAATAPHLIIRYCSN